MSSEADSETTKEFDKPSTEPQSRNSTEPNWGSGTEDIEAQLRAGQEEEQRAATAADSLAGSQSLPVPVGGGLSHSISDQDNIFLNSREHKLSTAEREEMYETILRSTGRTADRRAQEDGGDSCMIITRTLAVPKAVEYCNEEPHFDTGITAWLQVLGAFFLYFNSWGIINIFGVFQTYYEQYSLADESPSSIAWIGSVQSALLMLVGVISGPLFDAGYFYALLPTGSFLVGFGMLMTSFATKYYQIMLSQGICAGVGTGCLFVPSVALLPQYFKNRRALANGIAASGSSIGGVLYSIVFHQLQRKVGFSWATRVVSFLTLATCAISISIMRLRFRPQEKRALLRLSAFKELQYTLFCLSCFMGFLGFYNFLVYVQPYAIDTKIVDDNLGFYLVAILNATSTLGRVIPNFVADHTGSLNMLIPALAITTALAYCWIAVRTTSGIIAVSALYGFFSGGFVSLVPVVMMTITTDFREFGTRLGMCFALESIALLIGTPVGGAILKSTGSYFGVQLFCGSCLAVCAMVLLTVRLLRSGPKLLYKT